MKPLDTKKKNWEIRNQIRAENGEQEDETNMIFD
jgi:hypothetical protein